MTTGSVDPLWHYSRPWVLEELVGFLRKRWVGLEARGRRWIRWLGDKPLRVERKEDVLSLLRLYRSMGARSFYGTIEVFHRLEERSDIEENYEHNVARATAFIDIDVVDYSDLNKAWECIVEAARVVYEELCSNGVCESVYMLWSGGGMHVRVHENAFSRVLEKTHPINAAFSIAEYVLRRTRDKLRMIIEKCRAKIKVENLVAPKRVFTAPLSLHRSLDRVAVPLRPEDLEKFSLEWSDPWKPRCSSRAWEKFVEGEADRIVFKALQEVREKKHSVLSLLPERASHAAQAVQAGLSTREPGRFQVMALLQAVRYYILYGSLDKAKSFGLNRAIFYAWAKHYGPSRRPSRASREAIRKYSVSARSLLGDEEVKWVEAAGEKLQVSRSGWFVMGGVEQRPEDFDRNVVRRFEEAGIRFEEAWRAALEYLRRFPQTILRDPQKFYSEVYEPVRDKFVEKVLGSHDKPSREPSLLNWLRKKSYGSH